MTGGQKHIKLATSYLQFAASFTLQQPTHVPKCHEQVLVGREGGGNDVIHPGVTKEKGNSEQVLG